MSPLAEAVEQLSALLVRASLRVDEAGRSYYYEEVNVKRFVPDDGACEICEDAADLDWIEDDAVFEGVFGDEDGPPLHPHCGCGLEYKVKRQRVYT